MAKQITEALWVKWIDSSSRSGWLTSSDCKGEIIKCESLGFLVEETKDVIALAQSRSFEEDMRPYADIISIPKIAILERKSISLI